MALNLLYRPAASSDVDAALNIVIVPGIGLPRPTEWKNTSGAWLEEIYKLNSDCVQVWHYDYEIVKGQTFLQSLLQQSHVLPTLLHRINPRDLPCRSILIVCQSLGGCIWKRAYSNMVERMHEHNNILDHILGVIFLGTPHVEDASRLDLNIVESMVRASSAPFSFFSFTGEDNRSIAQISRGFTGFPGQVVSTFETIESKYRALKFISRSRVVIPKQLATPSPNAAAKLYGISSNHENLCRVDIGGALYEEIARIVEAAVQKYKTPPTPQENAEPSEPRTVGSVLDGWDTQSLRSHRSRMANPIAGTSSKGLSEAETPPVGSPEQSRSLSVPSMEPKHSRTASASAGYSSQFSYEVIPSPSQIELNAPRVNIPCFSVGSQTRKSPFFGRDDILRSIDKSLLPKEASSSIEENSNDAPRNLKTFALCGPGGIGKTELASEYIFSRKGDYSAIFWVTADSRNALLEDYARIALELGLQDKKDTQDLAEASELVKGWFCNPVRDLEAPLDSPENEVSWLLVLDNVDNWGDLEDFWPTTGIGSILITSRDPLSRSHIYTTQHGVDLHPFSPSESIDFLDTVSHKNFKGSAASAKAVANWAGGLPLIITSIASTMSSRNLTYNGMLDLLGKSGFQAVSADNNPQEHSVQTITIASMIGLACLDEQTQSLIHVISFLNPDGIPQKILAQNSDRIEFLGFPKTYTELLDAQNKLQQSSLITFNESTQTIKMHRIYQDIVRESLTPEMRVKVLLMALDIVSEAWVHQPLENRFNTERYDACTAVFPHVDRISQHYGEMFRGRKIEASEKAAALFNDAGWYWFERGLPQESKPFCQLAQSVCETLQQTKPSDLVAEMLRESHNNQGSAANETNNPQESLQHNLMWLSLMRERHSRDGKELIDYELGCVYNEVGVAYAMNGMYALALDFFQNSVSTYKSLPDYDEKWLGWPLPNIGMVHWVQGNHEEALKALHQMREVYEAAYGRDDKKSFKTGKILYGIGNVYLSLGDLDRAMEYHLRCLNQWTETLGAAHHRIGDVSHKIAQDLMGEGQFDKAQEYLNKALAIFARRPYHKNEHVRTIFRQGQLYFAQGRFDLAEQSFKAAHKQRLNLTPTDTRPWDELSEKEYDDLVIFMSR